MHRTNLRRACAALAAAAALTGVAACDSGGGAAEGKAKASQSSTGGSRQDKGSDGSGQSSSSGSKVSLAALQRVESRTEQANSSKVTGSMVMGTTSMTMDGALDWSHQLTGNLTMQQKGGALEKLGGDGKMLARYTPDAMYVNMGPSFAEKAQGKHWLKYDYDDLAAYAGASGDVMKDQLQHNNPTQSVRMLLASGDVKKVGSEKIGSDDTTHYTGTIDVADFTEKSSRTLSKEQLDAFKKQLEQSGVTTERIDVWVNGDDLLVKKIEAADTPQGKMKVTCFYTDYGTQVDVQVPQSSDTIDFKKLVNQQAG
ncbi:hypothetical protein [Wenjunlia tyrosinilytica]|uniref:Lipoprotein n=1 Tax=Wenjunlia tyrosinilytica TaxID=1544741 RepID=A0A918DVE8_9ACTN|nr:hypothetical protein [Wenjunlia tyrosinilytica]GGO83730.1 putative lipoprotein [Wenjunlia tyrosinilytica]